MKKKPRRSPLPPDLTWARVKELVVDPIGLLAAELNARIAREVEGR